MSNRAGGNQPVSASTEVLREKWETASRGGLSFTSVTVRETVVVEDRTGSPSSDTVWKSHVVIFRVT